MSDPALDRLKEFRAQTGTRPRLNQLWIIASTLVMIAGFSAIVLTGINIIHTQKTLVSMLGKSGTDGGLGADQLREYAQVLEQKGVAPEALAAYEAYLDRAVLEPPARANVCYSVAKLAADQAQYEKALAYLYQAEMLDPKSELKPEIDKKVTFCLEKLGRTTDLKRELRNRSVVKRTKEDVPPGEQILAEWSGEVFTDRDLDRELEKLPAPARESFSTPEKKAELLQNLVVERLLLDRAYRLQLEQDPSVQEMLARDRDSIMVRKLIEDEVRSKVSITPDDIERYYKAEPQQFTRPATAQVIQAEAESEEAAKAITEFSAKPTTVTAGATFANQPEAEKAIFSAEAGQVAGPVKVGERWLVFKVVAKTPEAVVPFDEAKDRAERLLRASKEQELMQGLVAETLKVNNVRLHLDRMKEAPPQS